MASMEIEEDTSGKKQFKRSEWPGLAAIPVGEMHDYYQQLWSDKMDFRENNERLQHLRIWMDGVVEQNLSLKEDNEELRKNYDVLLKTIAGMGYGYGYGDSEFGAGAEGVAPWKDGLSDGYTGKRGPGADGKGERSRGPGSDGSGDRYGPGTGGSGDKYGPGTGGSGDKYGPGADGKYGPGTGSSGDKYGPGTGSSGDKYGPGTDGSGDKYAPGKGGSGDKRGPGAGKYGPGTDGSGDKRGPGTDRFGDKRGPGSKRGPGAGKEGEQNDQDGGGSRNNRRPGDFRVPFGGRAGSRQADTALILRLQEQLEDKNEQIKQRDQRLKEASTKNKNEKKALQNTLNDVRRQLMDKENELDEKLSEKEAELDGLRDEIQKHQDTQSDLDAWKARAEAAESSVKEMSEEKEKGEVQNEKLAQELRRQIQHNQAALQAKEAELTKIFQIRWEDLRRTWEKNMASWKKEFVERTEKEKEREIKDLAKEKMYLEKQMEQRKEGDLQDRVENEKLKSRMQAMEIMLRKEQQAKEAAMDELAGARAEFNQQLEDLRSQLALEKERRQDLEKEIKYLQQKIGIQSEAEVYTNTLSEFETSMELQTRKRRRTSIIDNYAGRTIFRATRPSDSPIPSLGPNGNYVLGKKKPAFAFTDFENIVSSGPFLKIANQTETVQNLKGYSLTVRSKTRNKTEKLDFEDYLVQPGDEVRIVTKATKNKQENDLEMKAEWDSNDEELEVSLVDPEGKLIAGPIPLNKPQEQTCVLS